VGHQAGKTPSVGPECPPNTRQARAALEQRAQQRADDLVEDSEGGKTDDDGGGDDS